MNYINLRFVPATVNGQRVYIVNNVMKLGHNSPPTHLLPRNPYNPAVGSISE